MVPSYKFVIKQYNITYILINMMRKRFFFIQKNNLINKILAIFIWILSPTVLHTLTWISDMNKFLLRRICMFISHKYMTKNARLLFILVFLTPRVELWSVWKFNQSPTLRKSTPCYQENVLEVSCMCVLLVVVDHATFNIYKVLYIPL